MKQEDYRFIRSCFLEIRNGKDEYIVHANKWMLKGYLIKLEYENNIDTKIAEKLSKYASNLSIYGVCIKELTFKEFKEKYNGGYYLTAAEDINGFYKKGQSIYGNCDDMIVESYLYQPLNGIYSVCLKNA